MKYIASWVIPAVICIVIWLPIWAVGRIGHAMGVPAGWLVSGSVLALALLGVAVDMRRRWRRGDFADYWPNLRRDFRDLGDLYWRRGRD